MSDVTVPVAVLGAIGAAVVAGFGALWRAWEKERDERKTEQREVARLLARAQWTMERLQGRKPSSAPESLEEDTGVYRQLKGNVESLCAPRVPGVDDLVREYLENTPKPRKRSVR